MMRGDGVMGDRSTKVQAPHAESPPVGDQGPPTPRYPSLQLAYDQCRHDYEGQFAQLDSLRTKAGALIGVAAGVIAAALTLASTATFTHSGWKPALPIGVVFLLISCVVLGLLYPLFRLKVTPTPRPLVEKYAARPLEDTQLMVISTTLAAMESNSKILGHLNVLYTAGVACLGVGAISTGAYLLTRL
jgi:hypothetical protein